MKFKNKQPGNEITAPANYEKGYIKPVDMERSQCISCSTQDNPITLPGYPDNELRCHSCDFENEVERLLKNKLDNPSNTPGQ